MPCECNLQRYIGVLAIRGEVNKSIEEARNDKAGTVRVVALQVEFERQILKPGFHLIGFRLWV